MRVWSFPDNFNKHHFNGLKSQKNFIIELRIKAMVRGHIPIRSFVLIQNYWINPNWMFRVKFGLTCGNSAVLHTYAENKNVFRKFNT